jgi:hypothetical protein
LIASINLSAEPATLNLSRTLPKLPERVILLAQNRAKDTSRILPAKHLNVK